MCVYIYINMPAKETNGPITNTAGYLRGKKNKIIQQKNHGVYADNRKRKGWHKARLCGFDWIPRQD